MPFRLCHCSCKSNLLNYALYVDVKVFGNFYSRFHFCSWRLLLAFALCGPSKMASLQHITRPMVSSPSELSPSQPIVNYQFNIKVVNPRDLPSKLSAQTCKRAKYRGFVAATQWEASSSVQNALLVPVDLVSRPLWRQVLAAG